MLIQHLIRRLIILNCVQEGKKQWNVGATVAAAENWTRTYVTLITFHYTHYLSYSLAEAPANYMTPTIFVDQVKEQLDKLEATQRMFSILKETPLCLLN